MGVKFQETASSAKSRPPASDALIGVLICDGEQHDSTRSCCGEASSRAPFGRWAAASLWYPATAYSASRLCAHEVVEHIEGRQLEQADTGVAAPGQQQGDRVDEAVGRARNIVEVSGRAH